MATEGPQRVAARLERILESVRDSAWDPVVYSTRPLGTLAEGDAPGKDDLIVAPLPLMAPHSRMDPTRAPPFKTSFASPSEAAAVAFGLAERLRDFLALREHDQVLVRREIDRLTTLARKLEADLEAARGCERFRRFGEALLAGLRSAHISNRIGGTVEIKDTDCCHKEYQEQ